MWEQPKLINASGASLSVAVVSVFGPRSTLWVHAREMKGAFEFTLNQYNEWKQSDFVDTLKNEVRVFAPANLRASQTSEGYAEMIDYLMKQKFTLRYSGGKMG